MNPPGRSQALNPARGAQARPMTSAGAFDASASGDAIVAIATAAGRGSVGIVRVSGRGLAPLVRALCGAMPLPRQARYGPFLAADAGPIDHGLSLWFPAPHSYTGEDVLELQAHGGPVLLQLLLARCLEAGAADQNAGASDATASTRLRLRLAEPGEFTQRAFLNGKLDLAQAEAVADLIDASTEAAARSAARSLSGAFSTEVTGLAERLLRLRMLVEASLDFPEEDIDILERADVQGQLSEMQRALASVQTRARQGALLREGMQVVLAGQPNVGKSSLLNALAGAELAIVTPVPGTTRDRIGQTIQIDGVPVHVIDTAGLRADDDAQDEVERIGIARSWSAIAEADAVVFLHDMSRRGEGDYEAAEQVIADRLAGSGARHLLHVDNKADLLPNGAASASEESLAATGDAENALRIAISALTGHGLQSLRQALLRLAGWQAMPEGLFIARSRHVQALSACAGHLVHAQQWLAGQDPQLDLLAEELRLAHDALGTITGRCLPDELLGEIFSHFCIGK